MKQFLWVFGNSVQDITVEVDVERLSRESGKARDLIRLTDQGPEINRDLWLKTQIGSQEFAVSVRLEEIQPTDSNAYLVEGGKKYTLLGDIKDSHEGIPDSSLFVPCECLSWGGGGANVVKFLRALSPSRSTVPIKYTDIAMSRSLPILMQEVDKILQNIKSGCSDVTLKDNLDRLILKLYHDDPVRAEALTAEIARIAAGYAPDRSLEVYLASLPVDTVLYRPMNPRFRRNWVFSRFRSAYREIDNKIILRGNPSDVPEAEESNISSLLEAHADNVGAFLLNSLKDGPLFRAAYSFYKKIYSDNKNVVAILAMTEAMQKFTDWLLQDKDQNGNGKFPPFILVLNEIEAHKLSKKFGGKEEPFMREDILPDIRKFANMALTLLNQFDPGEAPRIYVTLGHRGSLGVDGYGNVIYVSSFAKRGATIFDTNACGDAYCAAIALLEWAKRNSEEPNIANVDFSEGPNIANVDYKKSLHPGAEEMRYFMAVATAAAYSKATSPRGRLYAADLKDLLQHNHLASIILPHVKDLSKLTKSTRPTGVDENFRLREPEEAKYIGVTPQLASLIS